MFHKNKKGSILRSTGTVFYSCLNWNSRQGFYGLKYMYSVISVIVNSLPGHTKNRESTRSWTARVRLVNSWFKIGYGLSSWHTNAGRRTNFWDKKSSDFSSEIFRERNYCPRTAFSGQKFARFLSNQVISWYESRASSQNSIWDMVKCLTRVSANSENCMVFSGL